MDPTYRATYAGALARNERGNVGRGVVCTFRHGDGAWRKEVAVGSFFVDLGHGRRLIGRTEGVVGRGT